MIRINLLPKEQRRRTVSFNWQTPLAALAGIVLLAGMGYGWWTLSGQVKALRYEVQRVREELQRFTHQAKEVDQLEAVKKSLEERQQVISRILTSKQGPARLLDELSRLLPNEIWLTSLAKTQDRLVIQGYAFSNFGVANLMTNLQKASPLFSQVELSFSEKALVQQVPVERFEITANVQG